MKKKIAVIIAVILFCETASVIVNASDGYTEVEKAESYCFLTWGDREQVEITDEEVFKLVEANALTYHNTYELSLYGMYYHSNLKITDKGLAAKNTTAFDDVLSPINYNYIRCGSIFIIDHSVMDIVDTIEPIERVYLIAKIYKVLCESGFYTLDFDDHYFEGPGSSEKYLDDIDYDDNLCLSDLKYLNKYILGVVDKINIVAADRDKDGVITVKDAKKYKSFILDYYDQIFSDLE